MRDENVFWVGLKPYRPSYIGGHPLAQGRVSLTGAVLKRCRSVFGKAFGGGLCHRSDRKKVLGSLGRPPAKEMISGVSVTFKISRMALGLSACIREAK